MSRKHHRVWKKKPGSQPGKKNKGLKPGEKVIDYSNKYMVVDMSSMLRLFIQGNIEELCRLIINALTFHERTNFSSLSRDAAVNISNFVSVVLTLLVNSDFQIPDNYAQHFIARSHIFANMVALSAYGTTDAALHHVIGLPSNYAKVLFLNTVRNKIRLNVKELFDVSPELASIWTQAYQLPTIGCVTPLLESNMRNHFENFDSRYTITSYRVSALYFNVTYFAPEQEKRVKSIINRACMRHLGTLKLNAKPDKNSIAIVTSKWFPTSAVFKSCAPVIKNLRHKGYKLTLVHTGMFDLHKDAAADFDDVKIIKVAENALSLDPLIGNDFGLAYYPDVGMTDESVWLSNLRIAPKQVTTYGHPASTWCDEMDYFIVGEDAEDLDRLVDNYSEETIVVPGTGVIPERPNVVRSYPTKRTDKIIVNCPWGPDKNIASMYTILQEILMQSGNDCEFHMYPSPAVNRYNAAIPFVREVAEMLGKYVVVHTDLHNDEYIVALENGHLTLNSYPFGGYNTVVESLYMGVPVLTLEGNRFYNKVASPLLRSVGLGDLICLSRKDFIEKATLLITRPDILAEYAQKLADADLWKTIFSTANTPAFEKAIDTIIGEHNA